MKKIALPTIALVLNMIYYSAFSQEVKIKKTFDHVVFGKRFHNYYSTSFSSVNDFLPSDKDLEYISSKTGKPLPELKNEREEIAIRLPNELAHLAEKGTQGKLLQKVELEVIQESPIKAANIILFIATGNGIVEEILFNCVQTNETWVLGDFIGFKGEKPSKQVLVKEPTPEEKLTQILENKNFDVKKITGIRWDTYEIYKKDNNGVTYFAGAQIDRNNLKNIYLELTNDNKASNVISQNGNTMKKLNGTWKYDDLNKQLKITTKDETVTYGVCSNTDKELVLKDGPEIYYVLWNTNAKYETAMEVAPANNSSGIKAKTTKPYHATTKPMQGTDGASPYVDRSLIDKPVRGYYIDLNGNKVDAVIKYQSPDLMTANTSALLTYNKAFNEPGFAEDESNNFKAALMKDQVLMFCVGGQVYIPVHARNKKEWAILLHEGAIKEFVLITKEKVNGQITDLVVNFYEKEGGLYQSGVDLILGFKSKMGALVVDNSEMVTKINNKEDGYKLLNAGNIIKEYNEWFDSQYPAKVKYLFYDDGSPVIKK